ncbi:MAG: two-component system, NarL family, response regulator DegU [Actinomycetota bacterium]|jgi:two-component system response regulator DegU|nr:two-component system, NarL family, response regulator DegU [Actinomycetota bacterium]MDQ1497019.1 two-component system, NarL family, response regulator DegU [Actinomycetota bacterium]
MTPRLLLVDDHKLLRQGLRRAVEEAGFDVVGEAGDGEEAVRLAIELQPDLVLMDVTMPVLDGIEATRRLRQSAPEARVVILTMHGEEETVDRALRAGAVAYLLKDCSTDQVADTLRAVAAGDTDLSADLARSLLAELPGPGPAPATALSQREAEVLQLFADGCSTVEVGQKLYISAKTVKNHLASIYEKLDARDRTQAVLTAVRMGIIRLN